MLVAEYSHDSGKLLGGEMTLEEVASLLELLGGDLEVIVSILILEEGSSIESLSLDETLEFFTKGCNKSFIISGGLCLTIECLSSAIAYNSLIVLLKSLLGEYLIDVVRELSPFNVGTSLGGLESIGEESELII